MDVLPEELWLYIIDMLDIKDLVRFSGVSRLANIISKRVRRSGDFMHPESLDQVKGWPNISFLIRLYYPENMKKFKQHSLYQTYGRLPNVYYSIHSYHLSKDFEPPPMEKIYQLEYSVLDREVDIKNKKISNVVYNPEREDDEDSMERIIVPKNKFVARYSNITDLSPFDHLQSISLVYCEWLTDITPIKNIPDIRLAFCNLIVDVSCLSHSSGVKVLQINSCEGIRSFDTIGNIPTLDLSCSIMTSLAFLGKGLKVLILRGCVLFDLKEIKGAKNLEKLDLSQCTQVEDLTPLASLRYLREVQLRDCLRIMSIEPLSSIKTLEMVDISYSNIENIDPLLSLLPLSMEGGNLHTLKIFGCKNIKNISPRFRKINFCEDM